VVADRGLAGGSKYRYLIEEHDRLRRVRIAQEELLNPNKKGIDGGAQTEVSDGKPIMLSSFKWVATKKGYTKVFDMLGEDKKHNC